MNYHQLTDAERQFIITASASWTPPTPRGRKIACPDCGVTGYSRGQWIARHMHHTTAPCAKTVTTKGLLSHVAKCVACATAVG